MKNLQINTKPDVESVFNKYPDPVRDKLLHLRKIILETANEIQEIKELEETLKWGEPSYLVNKGSTIRIDWKAKTPDQYAIYFKCTSLLVPTFKAVHGKLFNFEGDRAIVFKMDATVPEEVLKNCITAALLYHRVAFTKSGYEIKKMNWNDNCSVMRSITYSYSYTSPQNQSQG